jgi:signal transduction histidine kinase/putative methionine-R-sulfoxide reductase with GAF domain
MAEHRPEHRRPDTTARPRPDTGLMRPLTAVHARPEPTSAHLRPIPVLSPEEHLRALELRLRGMHELSQAITSNDSDDNVLAAIIRETLVLLGCDRVRLFRLDRARDVLYADAAWTSDGHHVEVPPDQGLLGVVVESRRPVNVRDAQRDPRFDLLLDAATGYRTRALACVPLVDAGGDVIGVLEAANKFVGYFTPEDAALLAAIGTQCSIAMRQAELVMALLDKNIETQEAHRELAARQTEVEVLLAVEHAAATERSLEGALAAMCSAMTARYAASLLAVFVLDPAGTALELVTAGGGWAPSLPSGRLSFPVDHPWVAGVLGDGPRLTGEALRAALHPDGPHGAGSLLPRGLWKDATDFVVRRGDDHPVLGALLVLNCPGPGEREAHQGMENAGRILESVAERVALAVTLARALDEERKAERLASIGKALSGVVHDLRTPLTVIGGYARSMEREPEAERRAEHRVVIKRQIDRIQTMIGEVLDFASGRSEVLLRRLWVRELVAELEATFAQDLADRGVAFVLEDRYKGGVKGDLNKLLRVFANLVKNAREAVIAHPPRDGTPPRISVRFEEGAAGHVHIVVQDNGPGFPKELEGRLFTSFATHGKDHGTGLGLAMARRIILDHGGTLEASSLPDGGAVVTITLEAA